MRRADPPRAAPPASPAAVLAAALLAGCAGPPPAPPATAALPHAQALAALQPGTTPCSVLDGLPPGPPERLGLDGGTEVRAWRARDRDGRLTGAEVVALCGPDGLLWRLRSRDADPPAVAR